MRKYGLYVINLVITLLIVATVLVFSHLRADGQRENTLNEKTKFVNNIDAIISNMQKSSTLNARVVDEEVLSGWPQSKKYRTGKKI